MTGETTNMVQARLRRSILTLIVSSAMLGGLLGAGSRPAAADVSSVSGGAFGYQTNVGLFDGYSGRQGFGQVPCTGSNVPSGCAPTPTTSSSPSVALPSGGSATAVTATDHDGAAGVYGPAKLFSGIWPDEAATAPPSGPMTVSTQGTPGGGSVTSSVDIGLYDTPITVGCASGFSPPCTAPGGIGPSPVIADEAHSTCTASESGVSGSASFVNGKLEMKFDKQSQLPTITEPIPDNPPPNYTRSGTLDHVGDSWTVVLNEQIIGPDSITVNAVHLLLLGRIAKGDMIIGSSTCSLGGSTVANGSPVANDDAFSTVEDTPLTVSGPGLLGNDSDPDANPLGVTTANAVFVPGFGYPQQTPETTWTFPSDPAHGTVTINGDGSFSYTPDANFSGTDSFTYVARDARGANDAGVATITVTPVPDPPVAVDDDERATEDTPYVVAAPGVLGNDTDGDGDPLTAGSASDPANGTVVLNADGSYTYTPDHNFLGSDSFTYVVSDGTGSTDTATVTLTVSVDEARVLKDIVPGTSSSDPFGFTPFDGAVFFTVSGEDYFNPENVTPGLWKTDGTAAGTVLVKNLLTHSGPGAVVGDTMFFQARDDVHGGELWKTDGTEAGTVLVKDINPGAGWSDPKAWKVIGSTVYFSADNGTNGFEIWKTDGTEAGTVMVKDVNPGAASSFAAQFTLVGTTVVFSAASAAGNSLNNNTELWTTDGTEAGTVMIKDINPGTASANPGGFAVIGSTVYFSAANGSGSISTNNTELWKSDGTEAGTVMVKDIFPGPTKSGRPFGLTVMGSTLLFTAQDGDVLPGSGFELWRSDGTEAGTVMVKDIKLGASGGGVNGIKVFGDVAYFSGNNGLDGGELWKTDGTEEGTVMVKDINPGALGSTSSGFTEANGSVYFSAVDDAHGKEVWKTDGTEAGTLLAKDINPGGSDSWSNPTGFTPALGTMFFSTYQPDIGTEPWRLSPPKTAPVGVADTYTVDKNTPLNVAAPGVLANDTDANLDALTAGSPSDPPNGSVTMNPDGSFTYYPDGDFLGSDTFTYTIDDGDGFTGTGSVTVDVGGPGPTSLAVDNVSTTEGGAASFTITRSGNTSGSSTVKYKTGGGTAKTPEDYTAVGLLSVTFAPDETSKTVAVTTAGDDLPEADETINLTLSTATGAVITDALGTATIVNDDGSATLTIADVVVDEGTTTPVTFTIKRSGNTNGTSTVKYKTTNGTAAAGSDYTAVPQATATFDPGETETTVQVTITNDSLDEKNETFTLALSGAVGATAADTAGTATIVDDDGPVTPGPTTFLTVDNISVDEGTSGTTAATFTVTRSGVTTGASTVKYKSGGGKALPGSDYTGVPLNAPALSFAGGETTKTVTVDVLGDTLPEANETFNLTLTSPTGAVISDASATATIVNDDGAALLSVDDISVIEGNTATFTVTRSGNTDGSSTVNVATKAGTASGTDFTGVSTSVSFGPGETTKTVSVNTTGDTTDENTEKFSLSLSSATGATVTDASGSATLHDND